MNVLQLVLTIVYFGLQFAVAGLLFLVFRSINSLLQKLVTQVLETSARATVTLERATVTIERLSKLLAEMELERVKAPPS